MSTSPKPDEEKNVISKWIAHVLDDLICIPGTDRRIGLDPIIGLIPGVGDFLTSTGGFALLAAGAKRRVPKTVYLRMTSNWVLNSLVGAIPFVGDAFSFWYKSNRRNYDLLNAHLENTTEAERKKGGGWWGVIILGIAVLFVISMFVLIGIGIAALMKG
ncbi:DUF4112 domain-containing protein [Akkermansiaceae bacterium]|nr:DUF4112 domain-containing protein [Akkermansiaceae bacterium]